MSANNILYYLMKILLYNIIDINIFVEEDFESYGTTLPSSEWINYSQ